MRSMTLGRLRGPLSGGDTVIGYTTVYTIILLAVAIVLTSLLNAMSAGRMARDETAAADYRA